MKRTGLILFLLSLVFLISPCLADSDKEIAAESQQNLTAEDHKIVDMMELLEILELLDNMDDIAALEDN